MPSITLHFHSFPIGGAVGLILAGEQRVAVSGLVLLDVPTRPSADAARAERERIIAVKQRGAPSLSKLDSDIMTGPFVENMIAQLGRWEQAAQQVTVPVLLLHGEKSYPFGPSELSVARSDIPQIQVAGLPCGHLIARECPSEMARHLIEFCSGIRNWD
jgi:pimeloyl-ACP methyl ester carboxylesterase